jgi:hypothetical protein
MGECITKRETSTEGWMHELRVWLAVVVHQTHGGNVLRLKVKWLTADQRSALSCCTASVCVCEVSKAYLFWLSFWKPKYSVSNTLTSVDQLELTIRLVTSDVLVRARLSTSSR